MKTPSSPAEPCPGCGARYSGHLDNCPAVDWNMETHMSCEKCSALQAELAEWKKRYIDARLSGAIEGRVEASEELAEARREIERANKLHDMDTLIMDGLRRVLATSRMALNGNTKPLELALAAYDKSPLPSSDARYATQERQRAAGLLGALEKTKGIISGMSMTTFPVNVRERDGSISQERPLSPAGMAYDVVLRALAAYHGADPERKGEE